MTKPVRIHKRDLDLAASIASERGVVVRVEAAGVSFTFEPETAGEAGRSLGVPASARQQGRPNVVKLR